MNDVVTVMAMGEWRRSWSAMIDASAVECTPFKGNCQTERYVLALLTWSMTNEQQHCTLQCHLIEYDRWWLRYVLTAGGTMWDRTAVSRNTAPATPAAPSAPAPSTEEIIDFTCVY